MTYSLDTNACIALINGSPSNVRIRFDSELSRGASFAVSSIVVFELWYGVMNSARPDQNRRRLTSLLSAPIEVVPFEEEDARVAGDQRVALEKVGKAIESYDVLIAGQAVRRGWTLVTATLSEFSRVKDLRWEDWAKS